MSEVGIRGAALDWITSYLHDRRQVVSLSAVDHAGEPGRFLPTLLKIPLL